MVRPPFIKYKEIGLQAHQFLKVHHPSFELPIPVEEIAEIKLKSDIVPIPYLFTNFRINGFLSSDCTATARF